ncbi:type VII secretion protein EccB [Streptomyces sp. BBFR2]|uniref:type VII secretion protein EccB n=1 Tax=Streptomyces sp. BBFR2 TaxID=3372854 RepID=UPI0037D9E2B1
MQNKQDQLQAHMFVLGRVVSALTCGEPDAAETPMRRFSRAAMGGIVVAALVVAGFAVAGLLMPATAAPPWRAPGTLITETETGSRYVYLDGTLHPVANYASARLLGARARPTAVPRTALAGVPHGAPVGIPGAPEALPAPDRLGGRDWLVCSAPAPAKGAATAVRDTVAVDGALTAAAPGRDRAALVQTPDGALHLVWRDTLLDLPGRAARIALGYGTAEPWRVSALWAGALTKGPELRAPRVPHRGDAGPRLGDRATRVGQILRLGSGTGRGAQYFLVLPRGLAPLSETQKDLTVAESAGAEPVAADAAEVAAAPAATVPGATGLPPAPPDLYEPAEHHDRMACAALAPGTGGRPGPGRLRFARTPDGAAPGKDTGPVRARVAPGAGVLAATPPRAGATRGSAYLITDLGVKYPLPETGGTDASAALGYPGAPRAAVPAELLALIPTGPALTPAAARREQPVSGDR